jgi:hypothetical protein
MLSVQEMRMQHCSQQVWQVAALGMQLQQRLQILQRGFLLLLVLLPPAVSRMTKTLRMRNLQPEQPQLPPQPRPLPKQQLQKPLLQRPQQLPHALYPSR